MPKELESPLARPSSYSRLTTGDTIGGEGLLVDVEETVELPLTAALLDGLVVVGETGSCVVERVDEEEGRGTGGTTGGQVSGHPPVVAVLLLLVAEERLEVVLEGKVQGLGGEVSDDVGRVASPERDETLVGVGAAGAVGNARVRSRKSARLEHLALVLDEELRVGRRAGDLARKPLLDPQQHGRDPP